MQHYNESASSRSQITLSDEVEQEYTSFPSSEDCGKTNTL